MQVEKRQAFDIKSLIGSPDESPKEDKCKRSKEDFSRRESGFLSEQRLKPYQRDGCDSKNESYRSRILPKAIRGDYLRGSGQIKPACFREHPDIAAYCSSKTFPVPHNSCCFRNNEELSRKYIALPSYSRTDPILAKHTIQPCQQLFPSHPGPQDIRSYYFLQPDLINNYSIPYPRPDLMAAQNTGRRIRTTFTPSQLNVLEKRFKASHYIVGDERRELAQELRLNESQVKIWFQNRRTKYKQEKSFEEVGTGKVGKRKGEHHVKKWQLDTSFVETTTKNGLL
ncbi:homeobox protein EMX1-like [Rhopilema esculentum]|uniref:homeobox protein EMX1-like n=1 Tax=Rhopilema esculentum TaxID=499914 RepID=UPI0031DF1053